MLNTADSENFAQSLLDNGRRKKVMSGKNQTAVAGIGGGSGLKGISLSKPIIITSPMGK